MVTTAAAPSPAWQDRMRHEVRRTVLAAGGARDLPAACWVGHPGAEVVPLPPAGDGVRAALVERALDGLRQTPGALCWLVRSGDLAEVGDRELGWWAAARMGFAAHDLELPGFCLVNRRGWVDLASGAGRSWTRVRPRPPCS